MRLLALTFLAVALCASATTYYVDPVNGNNANNGLATNTAWRTVYYATRHFPWYVGAGDTVYLRGGLYSGTGNIIDIGNGLGYSGTPENRITIAAYPGEQPIICDINTSWAISLKQKAYWTFNSIMWSNIYGLAFDSITNFIFTNCVGTQMRHDYTNIDQAQSSVFFSVVGMSQSNTWDHCIITNWAASFTNANSSYSFWNRGSPIVIGAEAAIGNRCFYNLIQNCTFAMCNHDLGGIVHGHNTIRSNLFYNAPSIATNLTTGWKLYANGAARMDPNPTGLWGGRITKTGAGNNDFTELDDGQNTDDSRTVFEWNTMLYGSIPSDSNDAALGVCGRMHIFRNNVIAFNMGSGIYFEHSSHGARSTPAATNNPAFYHTEMRENPYGTNAVMSTFNAIYNNTIYGNGIGLDLGYEIGGGAHGWGPVYGIEGFASDGVIMNNWVVNNIIWGNKPANLSDYINDGYLSYGDLHFAAIMKTNWNGDLPGCTNPDFVGTNGWGYTYNPASLPDLRLKNTSPCINAGGWLTICTGTGSDTTTLTVSNSLYFSDGNHMVQGDLIQLQGQTQTARVLANDWTNNVLTLDTALTWTNGQGVALAYSGAAPDMGAFEYAGAAPPAAATNTIRAATVRASSVRLR